MTAKTGNTGHHRGRAISGWFVPLLLFAAASAHGQGPPLKVKLELSKGPYYVGQGIVLSAGVIAEADRPKVNVPKVAGAEIWPLETDVTPLAVSGIGDTIAQDNLFLARFRLVPKRAGSFEVPSVRIETSGRTGASRPIRFEVEPPPIAGRPGSFLGGVGGFELQAEAEPVSLRVGQSFDYRIKIEGPAAWGSTSRPDLARFDRLPLGLRIEPIGDEQTQEPPSRTFSYRIRPTVAGEAALPAVLVSAFDPKIGRYQTKTTASVPLKVVAVASFDATSIDYRNPAPTRSSFRLLGPTAAILAVAAIVGAWRWRHRRRRRTEGPSPIAARRFASKQVHELGELRNAEISTLARRINEALIRYLELGLDRPPGALTPAEAARGVADLTGSAALGDRAERLLVSCDRALYGDNGETTHSLDDAGPLFRELSS